MTPRPIDPGSSPSASQTHLWGESQTVAIVGLGYVGLPLAVAFGRKLPTLGFDIDARKLEHFRAGCDPTGEVTPEGLSAASHLDYSSDPARIRQADAVIVAVPTPIDDARRPDLGPLIRASETVGRHLKPGAVVVYESTVYPGCTEEVCIPILERESGLVWAGRQTGAQQERFHVGYSPERINPGDREHRLETIVKVVSGDSPATLERVAALYQTVVEAGVHRASSIRVAEAAKVIENTQRDLNIALMNELAVLFNRLGIDTSEVLQAAGTKWNFLPFTPGLVGGHCIGVDPYYLTYKAEEVGHKPQVILAGRATNDGMGKYVAENVVKGLIRCGKAVRGSRVLILGLTFKENVSDLRNSRVADVIQELREYEVEVVAHDPLVDAGEAVHEFGLQPVPLDEVGPVDGIVAAVRHRAFEGLTLEALKGFYRPDGGRGVLADVRMTYSRAEAEEMGLYYWSL